MKVDKTIKLYMNGKFPRSESGRTYVVSSFPNGPSKDQKCTTEVCQSSPKDFRNAVEFAKKNGRTWQKSSAFLRSQILYRAAEMLQGKKAEFQQALVEAEILSTERAEEDVVGAIDQLVYFAGFVDKFNAIASAVNPVSGPFHNITTFEPIGTVVYVESENGFSLQRLLGNMSAILCSGNALIVLLDGVAGYFTSLLGEVFQTSDLPAGTLSLLSCDSEELLEPIAKHRGVSSIGCEGLSPLAIQTLVQNGASNLKRVHYQISQNGLQKILTFTEGKTLWQTVGY